MAQVDVPVERLSLGQTQRRDLWWLPQAITFVVFSSFIVYATWAAFQNAHYTYGPYLSPFYSPELFGDSPHAWFGPKPSFIPAWLPWSPALLILWAPGGFRFTCYYYRGAYYKAFWADPPGCAVGEPRKTYLGEKSLPLILQNVHRYFMYLAVAFLFLLAWDVWKAMWFTDASGVKHFGIGLGTLVLALNTTLLSCYTLGCHSFRHLALGWRDKFSDAPVRNKVYDCSSCLNRRHMQFAWMSLFGVMGADVYVRLCSMGIITDWRIF